MLKAFSILCIHWQTARSAYQQKIECMGQKAGSASSRRKGSGQLDGFCVGHGQPWLGQLNSYLSTDNEGGTCLDGHRGRRRLSRRIQGRGYEAPRD
jgi:hypothetical protein